MLRLDKWRGVQPAFAAATAVVSLAALVLGLSGCSFDTRAGAMVHCSPDFPCPIDEVCVQGTCRPADQSALSDASGSGDARGTDAAAGDAGPTPDGAPGSDATSADATSADVGSADAAHDVGSGDAAHDAGGPDAYDPPDTDNTGCVDGQTRACGPDQGACQPGTQTCVSGVWSTCQGGVGPQPEVCNGEDDDCDGQVDEGALHVGEGCNTGDVGVCAQGQQICHHGQLQCQPATTASPEVCNGKDDDCDGTIDEDAAGVGDACQTGLDGVCAAGQKRCSFGQMQCAPIEGPFSEVCDGQDDDCDGQVDETFPTQGDACDTGQPGQCATGGKVCTGGQIGCAPVTSSQPETCDGVDNDCDGLVDEDADGMVLARSCGAQTCPGRGISLCINGQWSPCKPADREICDGVDDNCDSVADNQTPCYQACPGGDIAEGTLDCSAGTSRCVLPKEVCGDGVDNDCDGQVDEGCSSGNVRDGMVYVAGGPFWMGSQPTDWGAQQDETPQHLVELDAFYIDRAEVTRRQYADCVTNRGCSLLDFGCPYQGPGATSNNGDKPIGCVNASQAADYCRWAGKRLPTEAEWEKAARGPFPRKDLFPWGNVIDSSKAVVNCSGGLNSCVAQANSYTQSASYYGVLNMAGNVAEWVTDYYDPNFYTSSYTVAPEQTTDQGDGPVVRGGSYDQELRYARVSNRAARTFQSVAKEAVGFRCALDAP